MENIKFYEVNPDYIEYLIPLAPHLFHNKKQHRIIAENTSALFYTSTDLNILRRFHHSKTSTRK
jgi:hypothetical protein